MSHAPTEEQTLVRESLESQRQPAGLSLAGLIGLGALWTYVLYAMGTLWHSNDAYAYGWLVPFLCLALGFERWKHRPLPGRVEGVVGPLIVSAGFLLILVGSAACLDVVPGWRFAGWGIAGGALGITFCALYLQGGRPWVNHFAFPLLFFLVAVPWPSRLELPLIELFSKINAALSAWIANILGTPAIRVGTLIQTGTGLVGVDEACSGIRSFQSSVMIALFLGELFGYSFFRRVFFVLAGTSLALLCNVVRTTFLVRTCDVKGPEAVTANHDPAGFTILGITLAGLLLLAWLFRPKKVRFRSATSQSAETTSGQRETALDREPDQLVPISLTEQTTRSRATLALSAMVVTALAVFEAGVKFWYQDDRSPASDAAWALKLPSEAYGFRSLAVAPNVAKMLAYDAAAHAEWRDQAGNVWQAYYFQWAKAGNSYRASVTASQARGHAPDVCLQNAGMKLTANLRRAVGHVNGVPLLLTLQRFADQGRPLHVLSCYWEPRKLRNLPQGAPSTGTGLRLAVDSIRSRDQGRAEKRVLKLAAWGMASDADAEAAFSKLLAQIVVPESGAH